MEKHATNVYDSLQPSGNTVNIDNFGRETDKKS